jgi:glycosyltransferase involved in cell wall biosynthesis
VKILFLTRKVLPEIGGVERHLDEISFSLRKFGNKIVTISEKNIKYPHIKFIGIILIWIWIFKHRKFFKNIDTIHIHDVFIWYLPFVFIFHKNRIVITIHGLEWNKPFSISGILQKKLAVRLSDKSVGVGNFLEKYLNVKFDLITYGAATTVNSKITKTPNTIVYVGRLEKNTGLFKFLRWLDKNKRLKVEFCGDGVLRTECEKYGIVHGFCNPNPYYKKSEYCVPGGYLSALEALQYKCKLKLFWDDPVKEDYWKMSPFFKLKGGELIKWAKKQTWEKLANEYISLYNSI